jgi:hypothetical protein
MHRLTAIVLLIALASPTPAAASATTVTPPSASGAPVFPPDRPVKPAAPGVPSLSVSPYT